MAWLIPLFAFSYFPNAPEHNERSGKQVHLLKISKAQSAFESGRQPGISERKITMFSNMKRNADGQSLVENQPPQKRKSGSESTQQCLQFCERNCPFSGKHNESIISLANLQDSQKACLEKWKDSMRAQGDFNQLLALESDPELRFPLLHWAAILGKPNAVIWLLQQESIFDEDAHHPARRRLNAPNKMVLFSTVRYLHTGVLTTDKDKIRKTFMKIVDAVRKHDSMALSIQNEDTGDTVLHLCAREEQCSTDPFSSYLKRIVGKLNEDKDDGTSMKILKTKNKDGDTFLHRIAKSKHRKEAKEIIDYTVNEKFYGKDLEKIQNADGKTAYDILNEPFPADSGVFQTSSQDIASACASPSETSAEEDEGKETSSLGSTNVLEHPSAEEEDDVEHLRIDSQDHAVTARISPAAPSTGRGEEGGDVIRESTEEVPVIQSAANLSDVPPQIFGTSHSLADPKYERDVRNPFQDFGSEETPAIPIESDNDQSVSHTHSCNNAQAQEDMNIQKLPVKLNRLKSKLAEAERDLEDCQERKQRILEEEKEKMDEVQKLEKELHDFKASLARLAAS